MAALAQGADDLRHLFLGRSRTLRQKCRAVLARLPAAAPRRGALDVMKYAVVSDIHANLEALTNVFRQIERSSVDAVVCLGDIVGYHANPNECIALLEAADALCITGNHDRAALGQKDLLRFSGRARRVIHWTKTALTDKSRAFLADLPQTRRVAHGASTDAPAAFEAFFCVHGALHPEPNDDIHLTTRPRIENSLERL